MLPLRELELFGLLVDPAAILLIICLVAWVVLCALLNRALDLNRFVWRRPLFDLALLVILCCLGILTMRPI